MAHKGLLAHKGLRHSFLMKRLMETLAPQGCLGCKVSKDPRAILAPPAPKALQLSCWTRRLMESKDPPVRPARKATRVLKAFKVT